MAQTLIATQTPVGPFGAAPGAGALDLVWTAADVANGNSFALSAREVLLAWNTDASTHHVTLTSAPDTRGRSGDITSYAVGAGVISAYNFRGANDGWAQSGDSGRAHISSDSALVKFAILTLP